MSWSSPHVSQKLTVSPSMLDATAEASFESVRSHTLLAMAPISAPTEAETARLVVGRQPGASHICTAILLSVRSKDVPKDGFGSPKYWIGVLTRIPVSIGNILKYWFLTDPTKYWNILEIWDPWLRNFIQT